MGYTIKRKGKMEKRYTPAKDPLPAHPKKTVVRFKLSLFVFNVRNTQYERVNVHIISPSSFFFFVEL